MKHRPDSSGLLYFSIAVLSVWAGELANLGGAELFQRIYDRWPALGPVDGMTGDFEDDTENQVQTP